MPRWTHRDPPRPRARRPHVFRQWRCPHCGKGCYPYRVALRVASRLAEPGRLYWHPQGGGYCVTRLTVAEYDARRGAGIWDPEED